MKRQLLEWLDRLRGSYWFIPSGMSLGAVVLAGAMVWGDVSWARDILVDEIPWLVSNRPDGARALLTTIAGSMITVAGVTFSITIAAVAYVSSQLGPRVLDTFMRDRGNQATLGTFIGTFIYCLVVLRTVRSAEEAGLGFVPELAVLVGFVLALVSVAVLIYFIHHIPLSIHASHVVASIGHELVERVDAIFPEPIDHDADEEEGGPGPDLPDALLGETVTCRARDPGYVTQIEQEDLIHLARERDLVVEVLRRPGEFVRPGTPILRIGPASRADEAVMRSAASRVGVGRRRTQTQDLLFMVNELAEIAGRALSPGVNDPFTAMTAMDWLGAGLARLAGRPRPLPYRTDDDGDVRVVAPSTPFSLVLEQAFGRIRPYVERDRNAAARMMEVLGDLASCAGRDEDRRAVLAQASALLRGAEDGLPHPEDRETLAALHRKAVTGAGREVRGDDPVEPGFPSVARVDAPTASD